MIPDDLLTEAEALLAACRAKRIRLALAESCTGGLIAATLTAIAGASDVFDSGFVPYSNEAKHEQVGVPLGMIQVHGAVSEPVARAMAEGALERSRATIAVSVTGFAGPRGCTPEKPLGLLWFGLAKKAQPAIAEQCLLPGDRTRCANRCREARLCDDPGAGPRRTAVSIAVVQPLPGIGDMIWHLPHIHAIAAHYGEPVTLVAKPRSLADQLMEGDPAVRDVLWVDLNPGGRRGVHDGPRGIVRLASELRQRKFHSFIMLHHSHTIAAAALLAGIPDRRGYGWGAQRWLLSGKPWLPKAVARLHPNARATRFLEAAGIALPSSEPRLQLRQSAFEEAGEVLTSVPRPFIAQGIGSSEASRQFGAVRHAKLATALLQAGWAAVVLIGGPGDRAIAEEIIGMMGMYAARTIPVLGLRLQPSAALLSLAAFYVGNNTGMMNLSAAVGTRTYGLFGTYPPFYHAKQIVPILSPPGGPDDGMTRMTTEAVLEAIRLDRGNLAPLREIMGEDLGSCTDPL